MDAKALILEDIRLHAYLDRMLPDVRQHKIRQAREAGCTWREIAEAAGVSRQALAAFMERRS
jgi:hypothetical protein